MSAYDSDYLQSVKERVYTGTIILFAFVLITVLIASALFLISL